MQTKSALFLLLSLAMMFISSKKTIGENRKAVPGEVSVYNKYVNISGMKHDFFKLFFMTLIPGILAESSGINFFSLDNFANSVVGRAILVAFTVSFYHSTLQPMVNYLPNF